MGWAVFGWINCAWDVLSKEGSPPRRLLRLESLSDNQVFHSICSYN